MEPKIVERKEFIFLGKLIDDDDIQKSRVDLLKGIKDIKNAVPDRWYEITFDIIDDGINKYSIIGVEIDKTVEVPKGWLCKIIPPSTFAVFNHRFKGGDFSTTSEEINRWLEYSDFMSSDTYMIKCYDDRFKEENDTYSEMDIYLPIKQFKIKDTLI